LLAEQAANLTATDPDYGLRDLYNAIAEGNFPSWTFYIQVMTFEEAERFRWNPFDLTKVRLCEAVQWLYLQCKDFTASGELKKLS